MVLITTNRALIFDNAGSLVSNISFNKNKDHFKWSGKTFYFNAKTPSRFTLIRKFGLVSEKYYFYNLNNAFPLIIEPDIKPEYYHDESITNEILYTLMETSLAKDINKIPFNVGDLFNLRNIVIGIILLVLFFAGVSSII
jgi:hypothetical protein